MRIGLRKFNADDIKWIVRIIIIWNCINFLLDVLSVVLMKFTFDYPELYSVNLYDSFYRLSFQGLLFTIPATFSYSLTKNKVISLYSFVFLQSFVFHIIFLNSLNKDEDGIVRIYTDWNEGILYLINNWPRILDSVNNYWPLGGLFEDGVFIPESTQYFYLLWITLPLLYYFLITFSTHIVENRKLISRLRKAYFII